MAKKNKAEAAAPEKKKSKGLLFSSEFSPS